MATMTSAEMLNRFKSAVTNRRWTVLGITTFLGATGYQRFKADKRLAEDAKKKKALVLPFHRMKIVEEKKSPFNSVVERLRNSIDNGGSGIDGVIEMQADELVSLIHEAAEDPSIVGLYGVFGSAGAISTGGWAHLEEIRNALETFAKKSSCENGENGKAMYAYSNNFGGQRSMLEYYLASVFPVIHLQPQGDLNFFGFHATNAFFRGFLKKYGVTVDVWRHGTYKNMANVFTHSEYSKEHYENTAGILLPIHKQVREAIYKSRHKQLKQYGNDFENFWRMIESAGSLPAGVAHEIGFVDHLPLKDPLGNLVKNNKQQKMVSVEQTDMVDPGTDTSSDTDSGDINTTEQNENTEASIVPMKDLDTESKPTTSPTENQWKLKTDPKSFTADSQISIDAYARQKISSRRKEAKDWKFFQSLRKASESNIVAAQLLSLVGYSAPYFNIEAKKYSEGKASGLEEKIAIIKINGGIGETTARKAEKALRKVKEQKDIKCVVLRVDSPGGSINACESIYQEIQDIPQKVVVSFGNVSASGGYYISSNADQIFASPSTITGSIGVAMIRMNFEGLAKRFGITFDSIPTSALSGSNDPFSPVNKRMDENFANLADRSYHRFKSLVSNGRNMDMKAVEAIAKGRVWTGERAHEIGLVDKLGGLNDAVDYAQRTYTSSGDAQVIHWPPKRSFWEFLTSRGQNDDDTNSIDDVDVPDVFHVVLGSLLNRNNQWALDPESTGIKKGNLLFKNNAYSSFTAPVTSGIMLTVDENTAMQCMLEDENISENIFAFDEIINTIL